MGRWWGTNPETKSEEEIDIIGINEKLSSALFCECKYLGDPADLSTLNALLEKGGRWPGYKHKYFMLFSKSGFTRRLEAAAGTAGNIRLISLKEMYL